MRPNLYLLICGFVYLAAVDKTGPSDSCAAPLSQRATALGGGAREGTGFRSGPEGITVLVRSDTRELVLCLLLCHVRTQQEDAVCKPARGLSPEHPSRPPNPQPHPASRSEKSVCGLRPQGFVTAAQRQCGHGIDLLR